MGVKLFVRVAMVVPFVLAVAVAVAGPPEAALGGSLDSAGVVQALRILPSLRTVDVYGKYVRGQQTWTSAAFRAAYKSAVQVGIPARVYRANAWWMAGGSSLEAPIGIVRSNAGGTVVWTFLCMPHDCNDNQMQVVFAPGREKAWGVASFEHHIYVFGGPTALQRSLLLALLAVKSSSTATDMQLPLEPDGIKHARTLITKSGGDIAGLFPN